MVSRVRPATTADAKPRHASHRFRRFLKFPLFSGAVSLLLLQLLRGDEAPASLSSLRVPASVHRNVAAPREASRQAGFAYSPNFAAHGGRHGACAEGMHG
jgi:hypothetical protein